MCLEALVGHAVAFCGVVFFKFLEEVAHCPMIRQWDGLGYKAFVLINVPGLR